jgi:hypothetical protein
MGLHGNSVYRQSAGIVRILIHFEPQEEMLAICVVLM